jgi:hypothetical protein
MNAKKEFVTRFEADRQAFSSWIVNSRWNMSLSFWTGHKKTILWMAKPSGSRKEKLQNVAVSGQGHDHCRLGLWRTDCCGCDAKMGDSSSPVSCCKSLGSVWNELSLTRIWHKILLQHESARPNTSLKEHEVVIKFGWKFLPHLSYIPIVTLTFPPV